MWKGLWKSLCRENTKSGLTQLLCIVALRVHEFLAKKFITKIIHRPYLPDFEYLSHHSPHVICGSFQNKDLKGQRWMQSFLELSCIVYERFGTICWKCLNILHIHKRRWQQNRIHLSWRKGMSHLLFKILLKFLWYRNYLLVFLHKSSQ